MDSSTLTTSLLSAFSRLPDASDTAPSDPASKLLAFLSPPSNNPTSLAHNLASLGYAISPVAFLDALSPPLSSPPPLLTSTTAITTALADGDLLLCQPLLSAAASFAHILAQACKFAIVFCPPQTLPPTSPNTGTYLDVAASLATFEQICATCEKIEQNKLTQDLMKTNVSVASNGAPIDLAAGSGSKAGDKPPPLSSVLSAQYQTLRNSLTLIIYYEYLTSPHRPLLLSSLLKTLSKHARRLASTPTVAAHRIACNAARDTGSASVGPLLELLGAVVKGFASEEATNSPLLLDILLQLHTPMGYCLHRDQKSLLSTYHKPLTHCLYSLITSGLHPSSHFVEDILLRLTGAEVWPGGTSANTDKEVLLLEELEVLLVATLSTRYASSAFPLGLSCAAMSMKSENSRVSERALQFFKNDKFVDLAQDHATTEQVTLLVSTLCRNLQPSWNPTVNKMTFNVLDKLRGMNEEMFRDACELAFGNKRRDSFEISSSGSDDDVASDEETKQRVRKISLKGGSRNSSFAAQPFLNPTGPKFTAKNPPPATITGVAPWATGFSAANPPPAAITGVAPWAMQQQQQPVRKQPRLPSFSESKSSASPPSISGASKVAAFIASIKPTEADTKHSVWSTQQLMASPTLLPNLRFHDLVFGKDLGSGAFSTVKYARQINKLSTRSKWSEYAVKIISRSKIEELGYERSVEREIACLRVLSNPNIARLVSEFQFRDGAYLVLEYAANGDLHTLVTDNGSLDDDSAQFVLGEVLAALSSIHDAGFLFGDLKPENILITESGHIKLGDFGGCRAHSAAAKEMLKLSTSAVSNLRDGDWRQKKEDAKDEWRMDAEEEKGEEKGEEEEEEEDERVEGTAAYMAPETAAGTSPSPASDMWSLGCVLFLCIAGRPPLIDSNEKSTMSKIVKFAGGGGEESLFGEDRSLFKEDAERFIVQCCEVNKELRPTCHQAAAHSWFKGKNVHSLYLGEAVELGAGDVKKGDVDEQWTRRQHSSIWSPQVERYKFGEGGSGGGGTSGAVDYSSVLSTPIREEVGGGVQREGQEEKGGEEKGEERSVRMEGIVE